ncbi:MAG: ATP-binding protein [Chloroflexi bacterium]|nr:ATP-binding protein [Chloroflexota bacterium]
MGVQDLSPRSYRARVADGELRQRLQAFGAVVVEGARGTGKTETARRASASEVRLDVEDAARAAGLLEPGILLTGDRPRLIDEWQLVPSVWNRVRRAVDDQGGEPGQFILTGSAVPADDNVRHSGALRFGRLRMRPMAMSESGDSNGTISVRALLDGERISGSDPGLTIHDIAARVCRGGWPGLLGRNVRDAGDALRTYLADIARVDLGRLDGVRREPENIARLIRSLARHTGTSASARSIAADVGGSEGPIDHHTVLEYTQALSRVFVVEDQPAWAPSLRSRARLRVAPVRHFVDPSLAAAALGAGPDRLLQDVELFGFLFESLVLHDLRVYVQPLGAQVLHYRDSGDLEADMIIERPDGRWAAIEVKLGPGAIDAAAVSLRRLADRIDQERHGAPLALVVMTGWGYAYQRPDGVAVVPIGLLGP